MGRWGVEYLLAFLVVIFLSTCLYRVAGSVNSGLILTYDEKTAAGWSDCIYFSVVTVSSLGYGDIRPVGWGRVIASFEVASGLIILGLWISFLASRRTEVLTRRIHDYLADERLKRYRKNIRDLTSEISRLARSASEGDDLQNSRAWSTGRESNHAALDELSTVVSGLVRFVRYEMSTGELFEITPQPALSRLLGVCVHCVRSMHTASDQGPLLDGNNPQAHGNLVRRDQVLRNLKILGESIENYSSDEGLRESAIELGLAIARVRR
jgi:hypothetical protein